MTGARKEHAVQPMRASHGVGQVDDPEDRSEQERIEHGVDVDGSPCSVGRSAPSANDSASRS